MGTASVQCYYFLKQEYELEKNGKEADSFDEEVKNNDGFVGKFEIGSIYMQSILHSSTLKSSAREMPVLLTAAPYTTQI